MLAGLQPGEVLLVHGGASGIGTMAVQLAARHGARVVAPSARPRRPSGSARSAPSGRSSTATRTSSQVVREAGGADVVLDVMGAAYLARNVEALADGGRLVVIGLQGGASAELDLGALLAKRGVGARHGAAVAPGGAEGGHRAGACSPACGRRWRPARCGRWSTGCCRWPRRREAHRVLEASEHVGKIVLQVRGWPPVSCTPGSRAAAAAAVGALTDFLAAREEGEPHTVGDYLEQLIDDEGVGALAQGYYGLLELAALLLPAAARRRALRRASCSPAIGLRLALEP